MKNMNMENLKMLLDLGDEMCDFATSYNDYNGMDYNEIIFDPYTYPLDLSYDEVIGEIRSMIETLEYDYKVDDEWYKEFDEEYIKAFMEYTRTIIPIYENAKEEVK